MILCCGEALIDFIPVPGEHAYRPCPGGSILNIAVGLGRMQVPVGLLSRLSTDMFGDLLANFLTENHVNLDYCPRIDGPTTLAFVNLPDESFQEPRFAFYACDAVDRSMMPDDLPIDLKKEIKAIHFGSISLVLEPGATALENLMERESRRRIITLDPNVRPAIINNKDQFKQKFLKWVSLVDILRLSVMDLEYLYPNRNIEELLQGWFALGISLVILTQGADGVSGYMANGEKVFIPSQKIQVKDTVGAGDSFFSAALTWLYENGLLVNRLALMQTTQMQFTDCLSFASRAAAINCTREGANPPYKSEMVN